MIDILRDYLAQASSPEFMQTIDEAHVVLEEFGVENYSDPFVQILMMDDVVDRGQTVQDVYDATRDLLAGLLMALGVTVSDEARVDHLCVLLRGLKAVESFHDPLAILQHCELETHPEELLAEVLGLTTGVPTEELLVDIHAVNEPVIQRIVEVAVVLAGSKRSDGEMPDKSRYIEAWTRFRAFAGSSPVMLERFLADGMDVGYPFILYANMIGPELETLPPEAIAVNLVAMALVSSDGNGNPRSAISTHIETLLHDLDLITKVTVAANDLLLKCEIDSTTAIRTELTGDGQANLLSQGDGG